MTTKEIIKILINEYRFSQSQIARSVGVTPTTISRFLKDDLVLSENLKNEITEFARKFFDV